LRWGRFGFRLRCATRQREDKQQDCFQHAELVVRGR
jgi:hypothetical protein